MSNKENDHAPRELQMIDLEAEIAKLPYLSGMDYWRPGTDLIGWTYKQAGYLLNQLMTLAIAGSTDKVKLDAIREFLSRPYPVNQIIDIRPSSESPIDRMTDSQAKAYLATLITPAAKQITDRVPDTGQGQTPEDPDTNTDD